MASHPAVRAGLLAIGAGFALACGNDTTAPTTSEHIAGAWRFGEQVQPAAPGLTCHDTAEVQVVQSGARFTLAGNQFGICVTGNDTVAASGFLDIQNGRITGSSLQFSDADCSYTGDIADGDARMSGTVSCHVTTSSGSIAVSGPWHMDRADFTPPAVSVTITSAGTVSHGDTVRFTVHATDSVGLALVGDSVAFDQAVYNYPECPSQPPPALDSAAVSGSAADHAFIAVVPGCSDGVHVFASARDTARNRSVIAGSPVAFQLPISQVSGSIDDSVYTLGDTVRIDVTATNARGLGFIGYGWYNPNLVGRDSVAVTGTTASHSFKLAIPATAPATQLLVRPFARHRLAWYTNAADYLFARTTDAVRLPVLRVALPSTPHDIAYAAGADRVYLVDSTAAVREVGLAPFALGSVYPIAVPGGSLDLSPSEDSLLVALRGQLAVAVVRRGGGAAVTVPITPPDQMDIYDARRLRVVTGGGGRAMIGVGSGGAGSVVQLNLSDGSQSVRHSWYGYGTFERTGDRSRLLFIDPGGPVGSQLYLAVSDTFLPRQSGVVTIYGSAAQTSGDDAATAWLVHCQLLSADMAPIRTFTDPTFLFGPSALATDAASAYCGRTDGVLQFDAASGARVRAIWLPSQADYLKALPGNRLLAVSGRNLYLVTVP